MLLRILSLSTLSSLSNSPSSPPHYSLFPHRRRRRRRGWFLPAMRARRGEEEEEPNFQIDPVKAREALRQLDQQLQSLSQNQNQAPPRRRPPIDKKGSIMMDPRISRSDEVPEISNSYLAYSAAFLLFITVIYNVFFLLYIKPAVDGREMQGAATLNKELIIQGRVGFQGRLLIAHES